MTPDLAADLHAAQSHEWIALDLLVAHGMPRDCDETPRPVRAEAFDALAGLNLFKQAPRSAGFWRIYSTIPSLRAYALTRST